MMTRIEDILSKNFLMWFEQKYRRCHSPPYRYYRTLCRYMKKKIQHHPNHASYLPKIIFNGKCINDKFNLTSINWSVVERYPKSNDLIYDKKHGLWAVEYCIPTPDGYEIRVKPY